MSNVIRCLTETLSKKYIEGFLACFLLDATAKYDKTSGLKINFSFIKIETKFKNLKNSHTIKNEKAWCEENPKGAVRLSL